MSVGHRADGSYGAKITAPDDCNRDANHPFWPGRAHSASWAVTRNLVHRSAQRLAVIRLLPRALRYRAGLAAAGGGHRVVCVKDLGQSLGLLIMQLLLRSGGRRLRMGSGTERRMQSDPVVEHLDVLGHGRPGAGASGKGLVSEARRCSKSGTRAPAERSEVVSASRNLRQWTTSAGSQEQAVTHRRNHRRFACWHGDADRVAATFFSLPRPDRLARRRNRAPRARPRRWSRPFDIGSAEPGADYYNRCHARDTSTSSDSTCRELDRLTNTWGLRLSRHAQRRGGRLGGLRSCGCPSGCLPWRGGCRRRAG